MRYFSSGQQWILLILALFILTLLYFRFYHHPFPSPSEENIREVVVEVLGEVQKPGIQIFRDPPCLKEAMEKAGGLKEPASLEALLFSQILETGTLVTVVKESPTIPPLRPAPEPGLGRQHPPLTKGNQEGVEKDVLKVRLGRMEAKKLLVFSLPLDLNRVSVEDLCLIPGVGESLALEIVKHRERRGAFRSVDELKDVKGIGAKKYGTFRTFFTIKP